MSVPSAYLVVVAIWATTPLAVKWSAEGLGPIPAAAARMLIAAALGVVLLLVLRIRLPLHRAALTSYLAAGIGIFGVTVLVYGSALYVPSGLMSVLFGLAPIVSGLLAKRWLGEVDLTPTRWLACAVALGGLTTIFWHELHVAGEAWFGICLLLIAVTLFSVSTIWVKRIAVTVHPFAHTVGALLVCAPPFAVCWWLIGGPEIGGAGRIAYLAVIYLALGGSLLGFLCYYYILRKLPATTVVLVTVITPVLALGLGAAFNNEAAPPATLLGTGLIIGGLALYSFGDRMKILLRRRAGEIEIG